MTTDPTITREPAHAGSDQRLVLGATPETDAILNNQTLPQAMGYVPADFARSLERRMASNDAAACEEMAKRAAWKCVAQKLAAALNAPTPTVLRDSYDWQYRRNRNDALDEFYALLSSENEKTVPTEGGEKDHE